MLELFLLLIIAFGVLLLSDEGKALLRIVISMLRLAFLIGTIGLCIIAVCLGGVWVVENLKDSKILQACASLAVWVGICFCNSRVRGANSYKRNKED